MGTGTSAHRAIPNPRPNLERAMLLYLYCVTEAGDAAHQMLLARQVRGLDDLEPLFAIEVNGLIAAVSRVPEELFHEEALNRIVADIKGLTPYVVRHEEAVSSLLSGAPALLPMAFGAVFRDATGIVDLLRQRHDEFSRVLDALRDKREWGVKIYRDRHALRAAVENTSDALHRLDGEIVGASPGKNYLLNKRRARILAVETGRVTSVALSQALESLSATSSDVRRDDEATNQSAREDVSLVLKASVLVDLAGQDAFAAACGDVEGALVPLGFRVEVTGPWAPYSFVQRNR